MADVFKKIGVPGNRDFIAATAEKYFTERLYAHYHPKGYLCFQEYSYAGGSSFYPMSPSVGHTNPDLDRVLRMLQGDDDAGLPGFHHLPKMKNGKVKDRGHQKPDFLAFRKSNGVVAEVGTAEMRSDKKLQLDERIRALNALSEDEAQEETFRREGRPLNWYGMHWGPTEFIPPEGPLLIPVDANRVISTAPTWRWPQAGVYLYELFRYERHGKPIGVAVPLPRLSEAASRQARQLATQPAGATSIDRWPALRDELRTAAKVAGVFAAVGAVAVIVALAAPEAAVATAVAGVAALVHRSLAGTPDGRQGA